MENDEMFEKYGGFITPYGEIVAFKCANQGHDNLAKDIITEKKMTEQFEKSVYFMGKRFPHYKDFLVLEKRLCISKHNSML